MKTKSEVTTQLIKYDKLLSYYKKQFMGEDETLQTFHKLLLEHLNDTVNLLKWILED